MLVPIPLAIAFAVETALVVTCVFMFVYVLYHNKPIVKTTDAYVQGVDKRKYYVCYQHHKRHFIQDVKNEDVYKYYKKHVGEEVSAVAYVLPTCIGA